jgi:hypothetical protein
VHTRTAHRWGPRTCYLCSCLQHSSGTAWYLQQRGYYHAAWSVLSFILLSPCSLRCRSHVTIIEAVPWLLSPRSVPTSLTAPRYSSRFGI